MPGVAGERTDPACGDDLLSDLNAEQREAVTAPPGPLLVLAGAGSGKTRVLTRRLAHLIREGAEPQRILAITFTNRAAREMQERVEVLLGSVARGMWVQTFHSACARMLRRDIARFGYTPDFTILDADDQRTAVREALRGLQYDEQRFKPAAVASRISALKNALRTAEEAAAVARDPWSQAVAAVFEVYEAMLQRANCLDFDDLLRLAVRLLEEPGDGPGYRDHFRHVLVDEYQDTNLAQYRIVRALASAHRSLTAVGDEDQSIYRFRGADIGNLRRFEADFPDARVIRLERNYRSTQSILDAAGSVIGHNARRYPKRLWTDRGAGEPIMLYRAEDPADEAAFVAGEIRRLRPAAAGWSDFAVLYRTHAQSRAVEEALLGAAIPYVVVGGLKFYERKEIKDVLAYLRLLVNPADWPSFRRAVATPRRGVGDATLAALAAHIEETGESLASALEHAADLPGVARAGAVLQQFAALLARLRGEAEGAVDGSGAPAGQRREPAPVAEIVASVLDRSGLAEALRSEDSLEARTRLENCNELLNVAAQNGPAVGRGLEGLRRFLEQAALIAEADAVPQGDEGEGAVVLLTLHAAKGLEFPVVFLVGLEDGVFPHSRALQSASGGGEELEEERRLCYVGMTRARQRLYLSHARRRALYGGTGEPAVPSRFLGEVDPSLLREVETRAARAGDVWRRAASGPAPRGAGPRGEREGLLEVRVGERVLHPKWGEGLVVACEGRGPDGEVVVDFPGLGRRQLILGYARLRRA
jgi:DNA helicase-2/ATP-dependent DNA helicase PcrA